MSNLINTTNLRTVDHLSKHSKGKFRFITKNKYTGMGCYEAVQWDSDNMMQNPGILLSQYEKGVLHTIEFQPEGSDYWFKVFSRTGKKIHLIDEAILLSLKVGTINQLWYNTELYSQSQYQATNSKSWDSYAYQMNPEEEVAL